MRLPAQFGLVLINPRLYQNELLIYIRQQSHSYMAQETMKVAMTTENELHGPKLNGCTQSLSLHAPKYFLSLMHILCQLVSYSRRTIATAKSTLISPHFSSASIVLGRSWFYAIFDSGPTQSWQIKAFKVYIIEIIPIV